MKNCPVCNTQVEDLYTGLCPNSLCSWEFEFISSEMTPELQKRYAEKLAKCRYLYELNIASDKRISTLKDKKDKKKEEFEQKIYRANIIAFIFQGLVLIVSGILIYIQYKSSLPTILAPIFLFIGYICFFIYFLAACYELFDDKSFCKIKLSESFKVTICFIVGYIGVNIIFSLSESGWIILLLIPLAGIIAVVYFLLLFFEEYLEERLKK
jgi:hypothetical protein